jgi:flagellar hook-associated protein 2
MPAINQLDPYFTTIINELMVLERQPLDRLQVQKDTLSVRRGAYEDVRSRLGGLQSAVKGLISTSTSFAITTGRTAAISNVPSGYSVLTASASSSAVPGTYNLDVTSLAKEHRVRSRQLSYSDQALGLDGKFLLGGAASRSVSGMTTIANTVTGLVENSGSIDTGQSELGSGVYYVETQKDASNTWQFRLVDASGNAVSIKKHGTTLAEYTSGWQSIPTGGGEVNTGRGLKITFGADSLLYQAGSRSTPGSPAAQATYTAKGAEITVGVNDTLNSIASAINSATFAEGAGVTATVVDRMLVLASKSTGTAHQIVASNVGAGTVLTDGLDILGADSLPNDTGTADGFKYTLQDAANAVFKVNGLTVTRSHNSSLTDVITGVTLNLTADAEAGKKATLTVNTDWSSARKTVDSFITKFNEVQSFIALKTSVESTTISGVTTYSRGTLADDNAFGDLRSDLFYAFMSDVSTGALKNLRELGLTIDDNLQATITDSAKLDAALNSNLGNVKTLLDQVMGKIDGKLSRFTGNTSEKGYLDSVTSSITNEVTEIDDNITNMNAYLVEREQVLTNQYAALQAQLLTMQYTQRIWSGIYGSVGR